MELRQLKYFVAVAEASSFSKAASVLSVAQPTLSRQISQLEEHLSSALFYRHGRGVVLTRAGQILLDFAQPLIERSHAIEREIASLRGSVEGSVTLGVLPSLGAVLLRPLLFRLRDLYPNIRLHVREGMSGTVLDWLMSGKVDIATIYQSRGGSLVTEPLLADDLFLVRRAQSSIAYTRGASLENVPLVLPGRLHGLRLLVDEQAAHSKMALNVQFEVDSMPVIKEMVMEDQVATLLPRGAVARELGQEKLEIVQVDNPHFRRVIALATATKNPVDEIRRITIRTIQAVTQEISEASGWTIPRPQAFAPAA